MQISKLKRMIVDNKDLRKQNHISNYLEDEINSIISKKTVAPVYTNTPYNQSGDNSRDNTITNSDRNFSNVRERETPPSFRSASIRGREEANVKNNHEVKNYPSQELPLNFDMEEKALRMIKPLIREWLDDNLERITIKVLRKELERYADEDYEYELAKAKNYSFDFKKSMDKKYQEENRRERYMREGREVRNRHRSER